MVVRAYTGVVVVLGLVASVLVAIGLAAPAHAGVTVYPVPTSSAGLGRIVTAPNGDMWFAMKDANKVGRITPAGVITEFDLGPQTVEGSSVYGIDVGADGWVWVNHDSGWKTSRLNPATGEQQLMVEFDYPYAGDVRVTPDGAGWITVNYDESGIIRVMPGEQPQWTANAPECEDTLGLGRDGALWCQSDVNSQGLVRVGADANSGVTFPLPANGTYPQGIAAGPVGSVWFTRHSGGTWLTSPYNGSVGYLDAATGATKTWSTGWNTSPQDLVKAPDGTMWFTNTGRSPGIGWITAGGVGVISSVGNYRPWSLTFGSDGAVWATDAVNNVILRVTTDEIRTTNIDLGSGVEMTAPPAVPGPGGPGDPGGPGQPGGPGAVSTVGVLGRMPKVSVVKKRRIFVPVACPVTSTGGCEGSVQVVARKGKGALSKAARYGFSAGGSAKIKVTFTAKGMRALKKGKAVKVKVRLSSKGKSSVTKVIKVRRR